MFLFRYTSIFSQDTRTAGDLHHLTVSTDHENEEALAITAESYIYFLPDSDKNHTPLRSYTLTGYAQRPII